MISLWIMSAVCLLLVRLKQFSTMASFTSVYPCFYINVTSMHLFTVKHFELYFLYERCDTIIIIIIIFITAQASPTWPLHHYKKMTSCINQHLEMQQFNVHGSTFFQDRW